MDSSQSGSRKRARTGRETGQTSTRRLSAYDPAFEQHLIDHGIFPAGYGSAKDIQKPHNWEELNAKLALPRASSLFTYDDFLAFLDKNKEALTEAQVMSEAIPIIAGAADIPSGKNLRFTNLKDLTDNSLVQAQPDFYDGSRPEELNKEIREEFGPYIVPSTNTAAPCLPNFFAEGKGSNGPPKVNMLQACYDGALSARGMHELRSYVDPEAAFDNNAYTITSTYDSMGSLSLYTTHPVESTNPGRQVEYRMTQLDIFPLTRNLDTFREGITFWRNARDWAQDERKKLIAAANTKALNTSGFDSSTQSFVSSSRNEPAYPESETSADELGLDVDTYHSSNYTTPLQARKKAPPKE